MHPKGIKKDLKRLQTNRSPQTKQMVAKVSPWLFLQFHRRDPSEVEKGTLSCHGHSEFSGKALTYLYKVGVYSSKQSKLCPFLIGGGKGEWWEETASEYTILHVLFL